MGWRQHIWSRFAFTKRLCLASSIPLTSFSSSPYNEHWRSEIQSIKVLPCWAPGWLGIMEDESNNKTTWLNKKQKRKKNVTANSDTDSEHSYPASQPTKSSLSTSTKKTYVPRFLIFHSEIEGATISSLSLFVVHKTIMSIAGEPKSIKPWRVLTTVPRSLGHTSHRGRY